jgi:hypothetical protein
VRELPRRTAFGADEEQLEGVADVAGVDDLLAVGRPAGEDGAEAVDRLDQLALVAAVGLARSSSTATTLPPDARTRSAAESGFRTAAYTFEAPFFSSVSTIDLPMPRFAPVTRATLSLTEKLMVSLLWRAGSSVCPPDSSECRPRMATLREIARHGTN